VEDVFKSITEGVKGTQMVAFNYLPEADCWAMAYWVLELKNAGKPAAAAPAAGAGDKSPAKKPAPKK
jgi:hypothetical protein